RNRFRAYHRRYERYRRLVSYSARSPRSTHLADNKATSFRWPPMVFRVPIHEPSSLRFMEANGCSILCVATEMEAAGRLRIAIHGPRRQGSSGRGYDQIEALLSWWLRP